MVNVKEMYLFFVFTRLVVGTSSGQMIDRYESIFGSVIDTHYTYLERSSQAVEIH